MLLIFTTVRFNIVMNCLLNKSTHKCINKMIYDKARQKLTIESKSDSVNFEKVLNRQVSK